MLNRVQTQITLREGEQIGQGGYSIVYLATEIKTGCTVALKKSRVSLRVKRPLLQHEARVLKVLAGHPAIPDVFAYGRVEHFELLSLQLLHQSLGDVVDKEGPLPIAAVLDVADQMLAALDHLNGHGLVHRDIKPNNIMLQRSGSWAISLIDFGLTYPSPDPDLAELPAPSTPEDPIGVFGTLPYVSIRAHEGHKLSYRDNVESLAYALLFVLRGSLPWLHYAHHGTPCGRLRQVYLQKQRYDGAQLALGYPAELGELVDYARSLPAKTRPDYGEWQGKFKRTFQHVGEESLVRRDKEPSLTSIPRPPPPVEIGQIVLVQLMPSLTAEGYSIREGHEHSYIQDPSFDTPEWAAPPRPAIVLDISWINLLGIYSFSAVAIARTRDGSQQSSALSIPISALNTPGDSVSFEPEWPLEHSYCYVFQQPTKFCCLPGQSPILATWGTDMVNVNTIIRKLTPGGIDPISSMDALKSSDSDIRHAARMRVAYVNLIAQLSPLGEAQIRDDNIDWFSERDWFDECVKASRRNDLEHGYWWTGASFPKTYQREEGYISESFCGWDHSKWKYQRERDDSLTLPNGFQQEGKDLGFTLEDLDEIVGVEG